MIPLGLLPQTILETHPTEYSLPNIGSGGEPCHDSPKLVLIGPKETEVTPRFISGPTRDTVSTQAALKFESTGECL